VKTNGVIVSPVAPNDSNKVKIENRVSDLLEGSFFGEDSILFDEKSQYSYIAYPFNHNFK